MKKFRIIASDIQEAGRYLMAPYYPGTPCQGSGTGRATPSGHDRGHHQGG